MLGRYTCLFDSMNLVPVVGSSRFRCGITSGSRWRSRPWRAVGVDRLARPGRVRLGWMFGFGVAIVAASAAIMVRDYIPAWTEARRWSTPEHQEHFRWLGREVAIAFGRTVALMAVAWALIARRRKTRGPTAGNG